MIEPLIRRGWRAVDAVSRRDRCDEDVGAAKFDVDPPGAADNHAAEDILKPGCRRLGIGAAQMNMVPRHDRHRPSPSAVFTPLWRRAMAMACSGQFSGRIPVWPPLGVRPRRHCLSILFRFDATISGFAD